MSLTSFFSDDDLARFRAGTHPRLYERFGAHPRQVDGRSGTHFAVWAPGAEQVLLIGDFNAWSKSSHPLRRRPGSGVWELFVPGVGAGAMYKYYIVSGEHEADKADPFAFRSEPPPHDASIVSPPDHAWGDRAWMERRSRQQLLDGPMAIYEVHLGSWRRDERGRLLSYRALAERLADYVLQMGFTHVELLPLMEHADDLACGFRTTGFFAPTSRYGPPQDFMYLVDYLHQRNIGVILSWTASRLSIEGHGLVYFDGTHLYEPEDPSEAWYPDERAVKFDFSRPEVRSFLLSNAYYWLERFHADGLRLDAVSSILYRDAAAFQEGWEYRRDVGLEHLEAIAFLKQLNEAVERDFPSALMIAEETSAWPMVATPSRVGGLGFTMKWNEESIHSLLGYLERDPRQRGYHHRELAAADALSENGIAALSHAECGLDKGSLLYRLPGDEWQKFANLRLLLGYLYGQRGKKLVFMGTEFGHREAWRCTQPLDWKQAETARHGGLKRWVTDLNAFYRSHPALFDAMSDAEGFEWIDRHDDVLCTMSFLRRSRQPHQELLLVANFLPAPRTNFRVGVPQPGVWKEVLNSDAAIYGGSGYGNLGEVRSTPLPHHDRPQSVNLTLPPLGILFFEYAGEEGDSAKNEA